MAQQKGYYDEAGLDVTIVPADQKRPNSFGAVERGEAQFGVAHSGILQQRIAGKPFVAMAAILQFSPYCWMVKESSDIFHARQRHITAVLYSKHTISWFSLRANSAAAGRDGLRLVS